MKKLHSRGFACLRMTQIMAFVNSSRKVPCFFSIITYKSMQYKKFSKHGCKPKPLKETTSNWA